MATDRLTNIVRSLSGAIVAGKIRLIELLAIGGQCAIWSCQDLQRPDVRSIARMALIQYDRLAQVEDDEIVTARRQIVSEHRMLVDLASPSFPRDLGLYIGANPLLEGARSSEILNAEPFLVLERIEGVTLRNWISTVHRNQRFAEAMRLSVIDHTVQTAMWILEICRNMESKGYLYSDISDTNLMLESDDGITRVRFVDPGGVVPSTQPSELHAPLTLAYTSPSVYRAIEDHQPTWPTAQSVMYSVGKLIWQLLTGRQPLPGVDPNVSDDRMAGCPDWLACYLKDLLSGREFHSFDIALGRLEMLTAPMARRLSASGRRQT